MIEVCKDMERDDYHIVLLGDGDTIWVDNLITNSGIKDKVSTFRFQDPVEFYSAFDIFVLLSRNEGFPLVALEAMMMGIVTIRSNVSGAYDMISNVNTGFIFENENVEQLRELIDYLLDNEEEVIRVSNNGKINVLNKFTEDIMIENTLNVYRTLV